MKGNVVKALLLFCILNLAFAATKPTTNSAELKQLDQQIQKLQHDIQKDQGKKGQLTQQYKKNAAKLAKLKRQQAHLQKILHKQQSTLTALQQQQNVYQNKINQEKMALTEEMQAMYKILLAGQQGNQENKIWMLLSYCQQEAQNQIAEYDHWEQTLAILGSETHVTNQVKMATQSSFNQQQKSQQQLALATQGQQQALNQLASHIQNKNAELKQLIANRKALDQLIKKLRAQEQKQTTAKLSESPTSSIGQPALVESSVPEIGIPFPNLSGKLSWPLQGTIIDNFGSAIGQTGLKYTGIVIKGSEGQAVKAVAPGQVIFANWLQGQDLLLIIDHGKGYMSLYGHNHTLFKKAGDRVQAGEMVANLGKNGKFGISELYFEIRHDGQPLDPAIWLKK